MKGGEQYFTMEFAQNTLYHSKAAAVVISWKVAMGKADIALIQESWVRGGQIRRL
jgi:hypothetical protein